MIYILVILFFILLISLIFVLIKKGNPYIYLIIVIILGILGIISFKFYPEISNFVINNKEMFEISKCI